MINYLLSLPYSLYVPLAISLFCGSVVSGFFGFAFPAVAGPLVLHMFPPAQAVPFLLSCGAFTQIMSLIRLRRTMLWKPSLPYVLGGLFGISVSIYVLQHIRAAEFRLGFGAFLICYTGYMLFRPANSAAQRVALRVPNVAVGAVSGLVGGLTAMPSVAVNVISDLRGLSKSESRGLMQPFIMAMQVFAIALFSARGSFSAELIKDLIIGIPVLAVGANLGLSLFGKVNDVGFRRGVLLILMFSGFALAI